MSSAKKVTTAISIEGGKISGKYEDDGKVAVFKGVPYAKPPVGEYRWKPPQPVEPWDGVKEAKTFSPMALQLAVDFETFMNGLIEGQGWGSFRTLMIKLLLKVAPMPKQREDCLYLNIRTPSLGKDAKLPVMVWIHGGDHQDGSGSDIFYNSNALAHRGVIVVSINYRLGLMGYFTHPDLSKESDNGVSGNYGTLDQIAALGWVQSNIESFGGDPDNVTIFGQSGGGAKVSTLMAMPGAKGLFHKAMTISGAALNMGDYDEQAELAELVLKEAGLTASNAGQLQELPWMDFYKLAMKSKAMLNKSASGVNRRFFPCLDNLHLPQHPFDPVAPVISSGIPMIIGNCTSEYSPSANDPTVEDISIEGVKENLRNGMSSYGKALGEHAGEIVDAYARCFPGKKPIEIWGYISWDIRSRAVLQSERQTANGGAVYNYLFDWKTPLYDGRPRAYHNSDLAFWFNNTDVMDTITGGGERPRRLAEKMSQALVHFARNGDPNHSGIPAWPTYDSENGAVMIWNDVCEIQYDPDGEARNTLHALLGE